MYAEQEVVKFLVYCWRGGKEELYKALPSVP